MISKPCRGKLYTPNYERIHIRNCYIFIFRRLYIHIHMHQQCWPVESSRDTRLPSFPVGQNSRLPSYFSIFYVNFKKAVYMLQLSRTEMLSTDLCSKLRGASFTFFSIFALKNAKVMGFRRRRQNGLKESN